MLKLYNTLGRKVQTFKPISEKEVGIYSCGPTVYNYAHVGNLRTYVFNDMLRRVLMFNGYKVSQVMNMTDVDDKTIKKSFEENVKLQELTRKYEEIFLGDLKELNILMPTIVSRATEHIPEMVNLVKALLKKGYAYKTDDGIYFSIKKLKGYGKLAQLEKIKAKKERIKKDEYNKENAQDFALWKLYTPEDGNVFWDTKIGKGRPGWHIECSAMSMKYLGEHFDIHTGGVDLIFPHHTNEIAQSEAATGKKFVNYWMHGGFLTMKEGKMAKSVGNVVYLEDLKKQGYKPAHYRYMCLTAHYRMPLVFSMENMDSAKNSYERLKKLALELEDDHAENKVYLKQFEDAINDDLNMPQALAVLWNLLRDVDAEGKVHTLLKMDEVLGLDIMGADKTVIPENIKALADGREKARAEKDWKKADKMRNELGAKGWKIRDGENGYRLEKI